jgi:hypothetical protein
MIIKTKFDIYDIVELKHDKAKEQRMITGINVRDNGTITYALSFGSENESWHYEFEIEKPIEQNKAGFIK